MKSSSTLLSLAATISAAYAIAFAGPAPTSVSPERVQVESIPLPTPGPPAEELKKRQTNLYPNTCGWVNGIWCMYSPLFMNRATLTYRPASGITCSVGRTCMLYKSASVRMAGCCAPGDTQNCGWADACVDQSQFLAGNCGNNCLDNDFVRKCTRAAAPYCVTWTYPSDGVADYGCAATSVNTIYTVLQRATDSLSATTRMSLPTLSGNAVTFDLIETQAVTGTTTGGYTVPTNIPTGGGGSTGGSTGTSTSTKRVRKVAIGLIVGIVIAALAVIFFIVIGVCLCLKKKKKQKQLAANAQVVAAAQANRPQSQFPPGPQQPQMQMQPQQGGFIPGPGPQQTGYAPVAGSLSPQSPQQGAGYFAPPHEQKYDPHASVTEYAMTPISAPSTPAPQYAQPHGNGNTNAPPPPPPPGTMPHQQDIRPHYYNPADGGPQQQQPPPLSPQTASPVAQYSQPHVGAHEVDAISVPHAPQTSGPVYEMGSGK